MCGVAGIKPTYGRVSRYGVIAFASSLDHPGPFGRTVDDVAALLEVIAGHDPLDATSIPRRARALPAGGGRRGRARGAARAAGGHPGGVLPGGHGRRRSRRPCARRIETLGRAGAKLVPVSLPHTKYAVSVYYLVCTAEASSNLARYDGVQYGHRSQPRRARWRSCTRTAGGEGFGREPKRRIILGTYVLRAGYYEAYYGKALRVRRKIADDFARGVRRVRRAGHADLAGAGVQAGRASGRSAADVPGGHLHRRPGAGRACRRCPRAAASPRRGCPSGCS